MPDFAAGEASPPAASAGHSETPAMGHTPAKHLAADAALPHTRSFVFEANAERTTAEFSPELSTRARQLQREGSVFDRLHDKHEEHLVKRQPRDMPQQFSPQINTQSTHLARSGTVGDRLYGVARQYSEHRDALQAQVEEQRQSQVTLKPHINAKEGERVLRERGTFQHRLVNQMRAQEMRNEEKQKQKAEQEAQGLTGVPAINPVSKQVNRSIDAMLAWNANRKERIEEARLNARQVEAEQCSYSPAISDRSRQMAEHARTRRSPSKTNRVEEQLLAAHRAKLKREQEEAERKELEQQLASTPQITVHSQMLTRQGDAGDRLYKDAEEREKRMRMRSLERQQDMTRSASVGRGNSSVPFAPAINERSKRMSRRMPVYEVLLKHGEDSELKRRRKKQELLSREEQEANKSRVGPYSELLVGMLERRTEEGHEQRIRKPIGHLRQRAMEDLIGEQSKRYTFNPTVNTTSVQLDRMINEGTSRRDVLVHKGELYKQKREQLRRETEQGRMEECTFKPKIIERPRSSSAPKKRGDAEPRRGSVYDRQREWLERIEGRRSKQRASKEAASLEECTFEPRLATRGKKDAPVGTSRIDQGTVGRVHRSSPTHKERERESSSSKDHHSSSRIGTPRTSSSRVSMSTTKSRTSGRLSLSGYKQPSGVRLSPNPVERPSTTPVTVHRTPRRIPSHAKSPVTVASVAPYDSDSEEETTPAGMSVTVSAQDEEAAEVEREVEKEMQLEREREIERERQREVEAIMASPEPMPALDTTQPHPHPTDKASPRPLPVDEAPAPSQDEPVSEDWLRGIVEDLADTE
ncbi:hypothetical protein KIPB_002091 [Kipferlia bialata]|uniref:Uncharacterized protein n=1 Tax=Kipferlia bialata TaxID=797122 RepID=A0A9K3GGE9_9EUKA|nr:hypothetical protein KIPB_002091 [Kipferlia bialata]|eukprot:g2091.t1